MSVTSLYGWETEQTHKISGSKVLRTTMPGNETEDLGSGVLESLSRGREEPWRDLRTDHSRIEAIAVAEARMRKRWGGKWCIQGRSGLRERESEGRMRGAGQGQAA